MRVIRRRRTLALVAVVALSAAFAGGSAWGANPFSDIGGSTHANNIDAIHNAGITAGCVKGPTFYCPDDPVTRAQMASFLARGLGLSSGTTKNFPKANARSATQAYCALADANPGSFGEGPCRPTSFKILDDATIGDFTVVTGVEGFPVIAYVSTGNGVGLARCHNVACTEVTHSSVDSAGTGNAAITITGLGYPFIAKYRHSGNDFTAVRCFDPTCNVFGFRDVDAGPGILGTQAAIATGADGLPVMAYLDETTTALKVARCQNQQCTAVDVTLVDDNGDVGYQPSIAVDPAGRPVVAYVDNDSDNLRIAYCGNAACTTSVRTTVTTAAFPDLQPAVVIRSNGLPMIAFYDPDFANLRAVLCNSVDCTSHSVVSLDGPDGQVGGSPSIALGTDGFPVISYYDQEFDDLLVLRCTNQLCDAPVITRVDEAGDVGVSSAITVGPDGVPFVVYRDTTNADLKVARLEVR